MKGFIEMADLIIKTSFSNIQTQVVFDTQELKITIGQAIILVQYEKGIEFQSNCDLKGHFIDFMMSTYNIASSKYDEISDTKIIQTGMLKLRLENVKKLNPNFRDLLPVSDSNGYLHYIV